MLGLTLGIIVSWPYEIFFLELFDFKYFHLQRYHAAGTSQKWQSFRIGLQCNKIEMVCKNWNDP